MSNTPTNNPYKSQWLSNPGNCDKSACPCYTGDSNGLSVKYYGKPLNCPNGYACNNTKLWVKVDDATGDPIPKKWPDNYDGGQMCEIASNDSKNYAEALSVDSGEANKPLSSTDLCYPYFESAYKKKFNKTVTPEDLAALTNFKAAFLSPEFACCKSFYNKTLDKSLPSTSTILKPLGTICDAALNKYGSTLQNKAKSLGTTSGPNVTQGSSKTSTVDGHTTKSNSGSPIGDDSTLTWNKLSKPNKSGQSAMTQVKLSPTMSKDSSGVNLYDLDLNNAAESLSISDVYGTCVKHENGYKDIQGTAIGKHDVTDAQGNTKSYVGPPFVTCSPPKNGEKPEKGTTSDGKTYTCKKIDTSPGVCQKSNILYSTLQEPMMFYGIGAIILVILIVVAIVVITNK